MTLKHEEREDLVRHHQRKARETITQVELLLENAQYTLAVNRIYYGVYYMLSAIALKEHFETSKHQLRNNCPNTRSRWIAKSNGSGGVDLSIHTEQKGHLFRRRS